MACQKGWIVLGEVQPGEAVAAEVVVSNDAERVISVSRVKACCGGDAELPLKIEAGRTVGEVFRPDFSVFIW